MITTIIIKKSSFITLPCTQNDIKTVSLHFLDLNMNFTKYTDQYDSIVKRSGKMKQRKKRSESRALT